jgi:hypothetical protein
MKPTSERGLISGGAVFSSCHRYRYILTRSWGGSKPIVFIMLNPSRATACDNDATIRRCMSFASLWGYNQLAVVNLFAFRTPKPKDLFVEEDPIGPENNEYIRKTALSAEIIVAGWGVNGSHGNRDAQVLSILPKNLFYLRLTKNGQPSHPLYLPRTSRPMPWAVAQSVI